SGERRPKKLSQCSCLMSFSPVGFSSRFARRSIFLLVSGLLIFTRLELFHVHPTTRGEDCRSRTFSIESDYIIVDLHTVGLDEVWCRTIDTHTFYEILFHSVFNPHTLCRLEISCSPFGYHTL